MPLVHDTIAAIATAPGRGGVGIVRISGNKSAVLAEQLLGFVPTPRFAHYTGFFDANKNLLDQGIALYFKGPNSFTGEDVLELQGHGGPIILDILLAAALNFGARLARPGEFLERAFLNDKLDLTQAEAISDLINASSVQAAKQALNSLTGIFSDKINQLVDTLIRLRMYVESAIDFPEEEIDFLSDSHITEQLQNVIDAAEQVLVQAKQGAIIREGMKVVIAGRPNVGKSSLLNALSQKDVAIVTEIAGTTRDVLREHIHIDGMPLHIIDTAGLRESPDKVETIGIQRAWAEIYAADHILLLIDATEPLQLDPARHWPEFFNDSELQSKLTVVINKVDQNPTEIPIIHPHLSISAKTGQGIEVLKSHLKSIMGFSTAMETGFSARRRHLTAIEKALQFLLNGQEQLQQHHAGELLAEDLRAAQSALSEITGSFTPDDLLGEIFSNFCIGK